MLACALAFAGDEATLRAEVSEVRSHISSTLLVGVADEDAAQALSGLDVDVRVADENALRADLSPRRRCAVYVAPETWAVVPVGDCADHEMADGPDRRHKAWDLARRGRIGGLAITGVGLAATLAAPPLLARASGGASTAVIVGAVIVVRYTLELGLVSWVVGHALEGRALRGMNSPRLTGDLAMIGLGASAVSGGLWLASLAGAIPESPVYHTAFIGTLGAAMVLDVVNMVEVGRPFGREDALSWTVAPSPGGITVLGRW